MEEFEAVKDNERIKSWNRYLFFNGELNCFTYCRSKKKNISMSSSALRVAVLDDDIVRAFDAVIGRCTASPLRRRVDCVEGSMSRKQ